jgi:hypothetical protein
MRWECDHKWSKKMDVEGDSNGLLENTVMTFIWEEYGNQWG